MNKRNQNSIIALATLGVYLGLLLAGATPGVLAQQAALTREFSINDEIEVTDNLDKNPDGETTLEEFSSALEDIYRAASKVSSDNIDKVAPGQYDFDYYVSVLSNGGAQFFSPSEYNNSPRTFTGGYMQPFERLSDNFLSRSEEPHKKLFVSFGLTSGEASFRLVLARKNTPMAQADLAILKEALSSRKKTETNVLRRLLHDNTAISIEKNRLILAAHLPRSAIDPLLATDAK